MNIACFETAVLVGFPPVDGLGHEVTRGTGPSLPFLTVARSSAAGELLPRVTHIFLGPLCPRAAAFSFSKTSSSSPQSTTASYGGCVAEPLLPPCHVHENAHRMDGGRARELLDHMDWSQPAIHLPWGSKREPAEPRAVSGSSSFPSRVASFTRVSLIMFSQIWQGESGGRRADDEHGAFCSMPRPRSNACADPATLGQHPPSPRTTRVAV